MQKITNNIWLGDCLDANNHEALMENKITSILNSLKIFYYDKRQRRVNLSKQLAAV